MKKYLGLLIIILTVSSCRVLNPSIMFKSKEKELISVTDSLGFKEYVISPNDILSFSIFTNDAQKLVDYASSTYSSGVQQTNSNSGIEVLVDNNGVARFPMIGTLKVSGLTQREAILLLQERFASFYEKPYVIVKVTNRRVFVFPGAGGAGTVVNLRNDNTSLIEVLASAGGLASTGKSYRIKLLRGEPMNRKAYHIDLSTLKKMPQADIIVQANDIVYVEPVRNVTQSIVFQLTPYLTILTSSILLYNLLR